MDRAKNKNTNKVIHASAVFRDTSYISPEEDVWEVIPEEVVDYQDVLSKNGLSFIECRFKKGHDRNYTDKNGEDRVTAVIPHFFIPNREKLGIIMIPESLEHKAIKNFIFEEIIGNDNFTMTYSNYKSRAKGIIENKIKLSELEEYIDWSNYRDTTQGDFFEVTITDIHNTKRVDVLIPFKKRHELLGEGIAIEVQLSKQSNTDMIKRTRERGLKGYSVIWIDSTYFEDVSKLNRLVLIKPITLITFSDILHNIQEQGFEEYKQKIQELSRLLDEKIESIKISYQSAHLATGMLCPDCKIGITTIKKNRITGHEFLGCTNYPKCNFTVGLRLWEK